MRLFRKREEGTASGRLTQEAIESIARELSERTPPNPGRVLGASPRRVLGASPRRKMTAAETRELLAKSEFLETKAGYRMVMDGHRYRLIHNGRVDRVRAEGTITSASGRRSVNFIALDAYSLAGPVRELDDILPDD